MIKLEATITVGDLLATLENIDAIRKDPKRAHEIIRSAGFLEGILYTTGRLESGKQIVLKEIPYSEIGWLGQKKIKTRKQTYIELMVEMTEKLIKELV